MCRLSKKARKAEWARSGPVKITVLGSGTSVGVPTTGCHCDVCESNDPRDNRLRPFGAARNTTDTTY